IASDGPVVSNGCNRSQTRTWTATDACGNTATAARTATWISDVTPPAFTGSYADVNLGCNPADPAGSLGTATATDACGGVTITSSDGAVVTDGCNRSQTRTFTARDGCNNTSTTSRTVRWISDLTPPAFTGSYADVTLGCNPANPAGSLGSATATDACGGVTITSSDGAVVTDGCNRSQTRTFTARDGCNNTSTTSRTVRWISDLTPPVITTGGGSLTLGCNPSADDIAAALGTATASDNCGETGGGSLPGSCVREYKGNNGGGNCPDMSGFAPTGTITLFFTSSFTVAPTVLSVTDNDPASDLSNVLFGPGDLSNDGLSAEYCYYDGPNNNNNLFGAGVILTFNLQFANGQGCTQQTPVGSITPIASDGPVVSNGCNRSQTRTWTATDACGNTATAARTATWISDVTPPAF
ncbi:MAG TPA: hypothetical protein VFQ05_01270, partial [Candidatus Eisenbacteria bacterium]|nr:hypothetical protein [Candidatus Eisenbacteria bacterium]